MKPLASRKLEGTVAGPDCTSQTVHIRQFDKLFGFFVGQVMKASRGKADPQVVRKLLQERLDALRGS